MQQLIRPWWAKRMFAAFSNDFLYTKRARTTAGLWTLLIFILCFLPGKDLPEIDIPLIDKWTHLILFGGFSFLWLCVHKGHRPMTLLIILTITIYTGWLIEYVQGHYIPGRSRELADIIADGIGGLAGIIPFRFALRLVNKKT